MKNEVIKYLKFILGLFVSAIGTVLVIKSNLGLSPWSVLDQGLALKFSITIGQGSIIVSLVVMIIAVYLGEVVGSGSFLATFLFGTFIDTIMFFNLIEEPTTSTLKLIMIISGVFIFSYGTYMCISMGLGSSPRDSLMSILAKVSGISVGIIRNILELNALITGFFLGGNVGVGTIIPAVFTGIFLQIIFNLKNFKISSIKHRNIKTEFLYLLRYRQENAKYL